LVLAECAARESVARDTVAVNVFKNADRLAGEEDEQG
jgi:hypothetical protein